MPSSVALVGAYSMSNYGDQLYPSILERLLRRQGYDGPTSLHALMPGRVDGEPVGSLAAVATAGADLVIVGGGDLVRTDRKVIAMDHLCIETSRRRWPDARLRARMLIHARFPTGPGPWLPAARWAADARVLLASVGVHELPDRPPVRAAVEHIDHAWVRTHVAKRRLGAVGVQEDRVIVAPDAVFALPELVDIDAVTARGRSILREATGSSGAVAVVHAAGVAGWSTRTVAGLLRALTGVRAVTLPLGGYAGEDEMLRKAAAASGVLDLGLLDADDVTAVLAAAGSIVTTSMHAAIVGACFGRPVVVPGVEKIRSALEACPVIPTFFSVEASEVSRMVGEVHGQPVPASSSANADGATAAFEGQLRHARAMIA